VIFDSLLGILRTDMAIDLGACYTRICVKGEGIVLNEPSLVFVGEESKQGLGPTAIGHVAREILARKPDLEGGIRPLRHGIIGDYHNTEAMLDYFIRKAHPRGRLVKPRVAVAVPSDITVVEGRAVSQAVERAGASSVCFLDKHVAALIGADLPISDETASMIVDVGGRATEVAITCLSHIAVAQSIRTGGYDMDAAIISHMLRKHDLMIGPQTAEAIKIELGAVGATEPEVTRDVRGRDVVGGLPRCCPITNVEVRDALRDAIETIIGCVVRTLEMADPALAAGLVQNGIHLAGGGALLRGLDNAIEARTGLRVTGVADPQGCVARGSETCLRGLAAWKTTPSKDYARRVAHLETPKRFPEQIPSTPGPGKPDSLGNSYLNCELIRFDLDYALCWVEVTPGRRIRARCPAAKLQVLGLEAGNTFCWSPANGSFEPATPDATPTRPTKEQILAKAQQLRAEFSDDLRHRKLHLDG